MLIDNFPADEFFKVIIIEIFQEHQRKQRYIMNK